ncbi:MAG: hypothetical protein H6Q67_1566 [Firmicutes bacterium]|nr:hypothetical protein [Bacillota bacterium]
MAKNSGFSSFADINEPTHKVAKEIVKGADLTSNSIKNKGGRKPKAVKADKTIRVYVTEEQKNALEAYCLKVGLSESTLIKQLLLKEGVF